MHHHQNCSFKEKLSSKHWRTTTFLASCLSPLALLYRGVITLRRWLYKFNFKKTIFFFTPVIVVGNITVGGTGKTPFVIWLANLLKSQGYQVGLVSRGYGGNAKQYPVWVTAESDPKLVGDEALLLTQQTHCPLVVAPNRVAAVRYLLDKIQCDIIISDDGLQHYALGRALEIVIIDAERGFGNGFCLPAGPLREPVTRLKQVDFIVQNGMPAMSLAVPSYSMQLIHDHKFHQLKNPTLKKEIPSFTHQPMHAVAGIGNPQRFFNLLRSLGLNIIEHPFPDHYAYRAEDLKFSDENLIIMTEKDAVKCREFADERFWYLPVKANLELNFVEQLLKRVKQIL